MRRGVSRRDAAKGIVGPWTARRCRPLGATMGEGTRRAHAPGRIEGQAFLVTFAATGKSNSPGRAKPSPSGNTEISRRPTPQAKTQKGHPAQGVVPPDNCRLTPLRGSPDLHKSNQGSGVRTAPFNPAERNRCVEGCEPQGCGERHCRAMDGPSMPTPRSNYGAKEPGAHTRRHGLRGKRFWLFLPGPAIRRPAK